MIIISSGVAIRSRKLISSMVSFKALHLAFIRSGSVIRQAAGLSR